MKTPRHKKHRSSRTLFAFVAVLATLALVYLLWSPGRRVDSGAHDLRTNGIWIQHGWLGDDLWFETNSRDKTLFRSDQKIAELADLLAGHGMKYVFPHLCPTSADGEIAPADSVQTEKLLDYFGDFQVIPWVGGVLGLHCSPQKPEWRARFISSVVDLIQIHPRLAGVQLNIEPMPCGSGDFLTLLDELRQAVPAGKIISVAAYPPPTVWHPFPEVHWDEPYVRQVARRVDQLVPMMYDTAIRLPKLYRQLMTGWTSDVLSWAGETQVLLGIPAYDDAGVEYHFPDVENLQNALLGIHGALGRHKVLPKNYAGVAIYCEWEMDQQEWDYFDREFEKAPR